MERKRVARWLLALVFAVLWASPAFANQMDDTKAELDDVQRQMHEMEVRRDEAKKRAQAASSSLEEIVGRLSVLQGEANKLQSKSDRLQAEIDQVQAQLDEKKREYDERLKIYSKRLREIYISGQLNYLDVLLGAQDFRDFASRMYLLQKIITRDTAMLEAIDKSAADIRAMRDQLDAEMREIKITQAELQDKKSRVDDMRERRAQVLYRAEEEKEQSEYEYERLLALSENIAAMLRNMETNGYTLSEKRGGTGQMMWPCRGEITSYYGWRTHPIFGTTKYHSGMDIAVDYGTPIVAADSGTVVYSGWLGGYGNTIMIDHGGGLVTLYGHNQSLVAGEGKYVSKGAVVAYAGSTGWATGPHCHFEVRVRGEVTEPLNYLPG